MARTGSQAIAWAKTQHTGWNGLCLKFVRTAFDVPAKAATARAAWDGAKFKHKTSNPGSIPIGVPAFLQGPSPAGHVLISLGGGETYTTDDTVGGPRELSFQTLINVGYKLLGWTEDLNGVRVYAPAASFTNITKLQKAVRATTDNVSGPNTRKRVDAVRQAAAGRFPYGAAFTQQVVGTTVDNVWGRKSAAALTTTVKAVQKAVGVKADGVWGPITEAAVTKALKGAHQA